MSETMPRQAVVLCGGRGTRLSPHTDTMPKPMVEVANKPFLEHLLDQLAEQGIIRFVLLTGYLGEQIHEYFETGSRWGWDIRYSHGPADWNTGRRVVEAVGLLDESFILIYSDNFAPVDLSALAERHATSGRSLTVTVKSKTSGNLRYSPQTDAVAYDPARATPGLNHVEIGYMLVERDATLRMLETVDGYPDVAYSEVLRLAARGGELGGHRTGGAYYSVSDPTRLELTRDYFSAKKILLIDRDGTISRQLARGQYVASWEQFEFVPETVGAMGQLADDGFKFIVITNQAGIALGVVEEVEVDRIHRNMTVELGRRGIPVLDVYMSPDHWDSGSGMRKPAPGMFYLASDEYRFRLDQVLYVGDDIRDCQAAAAAGCGMIFLSDDKETVDLPASRHHQSVHCSLTEAIETIKSHYDGRSGP
ncbi:MAG: HAD-IIIA family hydrolase [Acidimicrobiales bacterium]|nr:HAD-IIIA family hydrolase [Acidimicrobiales bacterium]